MIVWLASYPKSGNTWVRLLLENLLRDTDTPVHINDLTLGASAASREAFDAVVGYDSGDLTPEEVDLLRPEVYRHYAATRLPVSFWKVHDANIPLPDGRPLFPPEATLAAVYIVRNPLDIACSLAHHLGERDIDRVIHTMNDRSFAFEEHRDRQANQLRQRLLGWSDHVESWLSADMRRHVIRYEDLHESPHDTLTALSEFLGWSRSRASIARAIEFSRFDRAQAQEQADNFRERPPRARSFFRSGSPDDWIGRLISSQVNRLVARHRRVMESFGYCPSELR